MATNTIDAKLRIAAEVQQAITALKQLRKELVATGQDATAAARGSSATGAADPAVQAVKQRTAAERTAAAESAAIARQKAAADRENANQAKRLAAEEERRLRQQKAAEDRRLREISQAEARAARFRANQSAQLAPQLNDIFTTLATGASPLTVALQQGPQITQIYGGVANTFKAVLAVLTPLRVAVGGLAVGLVAAAAGFVAGYRESSQLRKELALTGNAANFSAGQLDLMAKRIASSQGAAIGTVRDTAAAVRQLAGQNSATIESTTRAATALATLSGESAEQSAAAFKDQAKDITEWAVASNRAYNFLTSAQVRYIQELQQQGRVSDAIRFANEELAKTIEQRTVGALGLLERAWKGVRDAASSYWEQIKAIGRDTTTEDRLRDIADRLREIDERQQLRARGVFRGGRRADVDQAERDRLQAEKDALDADIKAKADQAEKLRAEQEAIKQQTLEFRRSFAGLTAAESQRRLAEEEAGFTRRAAAVEAAYAKDVESAFTRAQKLNAIDRDRAIAQREAARRQIDIQRDLVGALQSPESRRQEEARLVELRGQALTADAQVAAAIAEGKRLVDAEIRRLDQDVAKRRAENELASLPQVESDPFRRAVQEAAARTQQARAELADLRRQQAAALATPANPEVSARLDQQIKAASENLNQTNSRLQIESLLQQSQERLQLLELQEADLAAAVDRGAITVEEAERRKLEARQQSLVQLERILQLLEAVPAKSPAEQAEVERLRQRVAAYKDLRTELEKLARSEGLNALTGLLNDLSTGAKTLKESLLDAVRSFARAMLNLLNQRLAEELLNEFLGAAKRLGSAGSGSTGGSDGGGSGEFLATLARFVVGMFHTGGVVGGGRGGMSAAVSPLVFAGAQVLHSGGIAGTAALPRWNGKKQVPIIALEGEEMLTEDDPRHIKNLRGAPAVVQYAPNIQISGAQGTNDQLARASQDLDRRMRMAMDMWAADNMRPGGVLAGR